MAGWLIGKVALVTGAGSGIGRASALAFTREGAKVVVADVVVEGGEETVSMIKKTSGEAIFVNADVSKAAEVEALINTAVAPPMDDWIARIIMLASLEKRSLLQMIPKRTGIASWPLTSRACGYA